MVVADFASEYQIRMHSEFDGMTWAEFKALLQGVLFADTRLYRHLNNPSPDVKRGEPA